MPHDEQDLLKTIADHIRLLEAEFGRIEFTIQARPVGERDVLEGIRERVSNIIGVMKADLEKLS